MDDNSIKTHIINTFLLLYEEKPVNEIQVNELINLAHIGRSTFYKYFKNVEGILKLVEKNTFDDMASIFKEYNYIDIIDLPENSPAPNFYETYKYILKHTSFFKGAFSSHGNYLFKKNTKNNIINKLKTTYGKYFQDDEILEAFSDYMSDIIITTCSIMLKHSNTINAKSLSIKTKKSIVDFIKNQDIYFNKKEKN